MFKRPTTLAAAFVEAAAKNIKAGKVDHQHWVTRRVAMNATERGQFGIVTEYDRRPGFTAARQHGPKVSAE